MSGSVPGSARTAGAAKGVTTNTSGSIRTDRMGQSSVRRRIARCATRAARRGVSLRPWLSAPEGSGSTSSVSRAADATAASMPMGYEKSIHVYASYRDKRQFVARASQASNVSNLLRSARERCAPDARPRDSQELQRRRRNASRQSPLATLTHASPLGAACPVIDRIQHSCPGEPSDEEDTALHGVDDGLGGRVAECGPVGVRASGEPDARTRRDHGLRTSAGSIPRPPRR